MFTGIALAAGNGERMKSKSPIAAHKICGKPISKWVIDALYEAGAENVITVIGYGADKLRASLGACCEYAAQTEQVGTANAAMQAMPLIEANSCVVILNGNMPLITSETINAALKYHNESRNNATVVTAVLEDTSGYGRIVRENGEIKCIIEESEANELNIKEINSGMYIFDSVSLINALNEIKPDNKSGEYRLTDVIGVLSEQGKNIGVYTVFDSDEVIGIKDRIGLSRAEEIMRRRINERHMKNGVTIRIPESVYIEDDVEIGSDTEIAPNVIIKSGTKIGRECIIGTGTVLEKAVIYDGADILSSVIIDSEVGSGTHVGPFAYIRPNCRVGENVKVGDFVELKNSVIDDGTKISHLTYVGDSDVGKNVNFGCGTVTVNYDGKNKHRTAISDNAFIGCNTNLVSPVVVGEGAYIAAGSTITDDVPSDNLSIARARQVNKEVSEEWLKKRRK